MANKSLADDPFFPFKRGQKPAVRTALLNSALPSVIVKSKGRQTIFAASIHHTTCVVPEEAGREPPVNEGEVKHVLRNLGLMEDIVIHSMSRKDFLRERDLKELGRGGEGAVYFTRGHVVKLVERPYARMALREVAHMLLLNPASKGKSEGVGVRTRDDFPSLIWLYLLNDGSLSIGMQMFDEDAEEPGTTFEHRMRHGPPMKSGYVVRMLLNLSRSLAHAHRTGIIHHDLKPANVYLPHNTNLKPVVFDFGQSLVRLSSWGRNWATQPHNASVWYNGTYRYMDARRRRAHTGALALVQGAKPTPLQQDALNTYVPDAFDDVFAFARMLRDIGRSPYPCVSTKDDEELRKLARSLMGLRTEAEPRKPAHRGLIGSLFKKKEESRTPPPTPTMDDVERALEKVLEDFTRR